MRALKAGELSRWQMQRDKLTEAIARVEAAPTMQGDKWKEGQLRHFRKLLANLDAAKPSA